MEKEMSCSELAQELVDKIHDKQYYSEEVMQNAMQLLKKVQREDKDLGTGYTEEEDDEVEGESNGDAIEVKDDSEPDNDHLAEDAENLDDIKEDVEEMQERDAEEVGKMEKMSADEMKKELGKAGLIVSIQYMAE